MVARRWRGVTPAAKADAYPEDDDYLLGRELTVDHFDVMVKP